MGSEHHNPCLSGYVRKQIVNTFGILLPTRHGISQVMRLGSHCRGYHIWLHLIRAVLKATETSSRNLSHHGLAAPA